MDEMRSFGVWAKISSPMKYGIRIPAPSTPSIKFPPSPRLRRAGRMKGLIIARERYRGE